MAYRSFFEVWPVFVGPHLRLPLWSSMLEVVKKDLVRRLLMEAEADESEVG